MAGKITQISGDNLTYMVRLMSLKRQLMLVRILYHKYHTQVQYTYYTRGEYQDEF